ncbi:hypothetical protein INR49_015988, partial [Caranx melampygus]
MVDSLVAQLCISRLCSSTATWPRSAPRHASDIITTQQLQLQEKEEQEEVGEDEGGEEEKQSLE